MFEVTNSIERRQEFFDWLQPRAELEIGLDDSTYLGFTENNKILACVLFSGYDGHNLFIHMAIEHPRICQRKYIKMMFDYIFNKVNCYRATATVDENNIRMKKLVEGVGFKREGSIRSMIKRNNKFLDVAIYGMIKHECKWI